MPKKNELTLLMAKVLLKFTSDSTNVWDQTYFRFYSSDVAPTAFQFMIRKNRELSVLSAVPEYTSLLEPLMLSLFDEMQAEVHKRPLVAVLTVHADKTYALKLDYHNPHANEIGLLDLGTANSYFVNNEVDIPINKVDRS
ncbi:hypothetical protein [Undibacterium sp. TS12]|uniref:hypothetical protein n=1 Tax=Undibacterium sp. TS12 TaxID=2908202 RepID=UPI001F4D0543|nr:hypothetical protein [Undibacterium sp. TS12]MCH8620427.1 hypothetical protein [Undibacterium sp. TS12]